MYISNWYFSCSLCYFCASKETLYHYLLIIFLILKFLQELHHKLATLDHLDHQSSWQLGSEEEYLQDTESWIPAGVICSGIASCIPCTHFCVSEIIKYMIIKNILLLLTLHAFLLWKLMMQAMMTRMTRILTRAAARQIFLLLLMKPPRLSLWWMTGENVLSVTRKISLSWWPV